MSNDVSLTQMADDGFLPPISDAWAKWYEKYSPTRLTTFAAFKAGYEAAQERIAALERAINAEMDNTTQWREKALRLETQVAQKEAMSDEYRKALFHQEAENARLRTLLARLVNWTVVGLGGFCLGCQADEPHHQPNCPVPEARAALAPPGGSPPAEGRQIVVTDDDVAYGSSSTIVLNPEPAEEA